MDLRGRFPAITNKARTSGPGVDVVAKYFPTFVQIKITQDQWTALNLHQSRGILLPRQRSQDLAFSLLLSRGHARAGQWLQMRLANGLVRRVACTFFLEKGTVVYTELLM